MQLNPSTAARRMLVAVPLLLAAGNICLAQENTTTPAPAAAAPRADQEDRLAWFRDARFGMFIHWGVYSELAGEWNGQQVKVGRNAEWIMNFLKIPAPQYREMARKFNPEKFDAEQCVRLAKAAGMRYLVFTAKHHDGFAMYHSKASPYNIVDWTPFKRDPLKELQEACARAGIRLCVYYSHSEDWDDPDAGGPLDTNGKMPETYERYLEKKAMPQLKELLTDYGPIGLVWFDRGIFTTEQAQGFVDLVRGTQPACLINGRVGNYEHELMGDYQNMNDNGMPAGGIEEDWKHRKPSTIPGDTAASTRTGRSPKTGCAETQVNQTRTPPLNRRIQAPQKKQQPI